MIKMHVYLMNMQKKMLFYMFDLALYEESFPVVP